MSPSIDTPAQRFGIAVAAAIAAAAAASLAFAPAERGGRQPPIAASAAAGSPSTASGMAGARSVVAPDAARSPAMLAPVLVRPPGPPDTGDTATDAVAIGAPAGADVAPPAGGEAPRRAVRPRDEEVATEAPARPAAPTEAPRTEEASPDARLARRLNREGIALIDRGRPGQAIVLFEQAAALQPRDAEILGNLGYACMLVGDYGAARQNLQRALAFAPNRSATWLNLGQTYAELGHRDLAVDAVVVGYRNASRKDSVRAALLAAATGSRHSLRWREAAGTALARIDNG